MSKLIGERLRKVADMVGGVKKFSNEWGMAAPGLYNYFKGKTKPGADVLNRLYHLGFGLDWLVTGNGMMFANNEAGRRMRLKYIQKNRIESGEDVHTRLRYFAEANFESIEDFAGMLGKTAEDIQPYFESRKPGTGMLEDLAELGCNLNWLLLGTGADVSRPLNESAMNVEQPSEVFLKITYSSEQFSIREISPDKLQAADADEGGMEVQ